MTDSSLSTGRRLRSSRESDRVDKAQATFHIITVLVIIGIVFFEEATRDISLDTRFIGTVPQRDLSQSTHQHRYGVPSVVMSEKSRKLSKDRDSPAKHEGTQQDALQAAVVQNSTSFDEHKNKSLVHQQDRSTNRSGPNVSMRGQNVNTLSSTLNVNGTKADDTIDRNNASTKLATQGKETNPNFQDNWIDIDDFRKRAEERAMYDALQKRAATTSGHNKKAVMGSDFFLDVERNMTGGNETRIFGASGNKTEAISEYRGVLPTQENAELFKTDNLTHLSYMIYRLIRTHNLSSVLDVPCTKSMIWMPGLLVRLEYEVPNFHYRCIVPEDEYLVEAILRYKGLTSAVVLKDSMFWASKLPKTDVALVWYGVGYLAPRKSWQLLKAIHQSETKYVVIPNHPDVSSNPGSETRHGRVNVRRSPYRFDDPLRVVNNVSTTFPRKQLLMYELQGLRSGVL